MRVQWIDRATYEHVTSAVDAAQDTPRDAFCASAHWISLVKMDPDPGGITGIEDYLINLDGLMTFLAMLAAPRPWFEPHFPRAFGVSVDEVNAIGRIVLGEDWAGIGALTLCEPELVRGALTVSAVGALEVVR